MPRWTQTLRQSAKRAFKTLPNDARRRIDDALEAMRDDPFAGDVVRLQGRASFRRRVGAYRIIFEVDRGERHVTVTKIVRRSETAYRLVFWLMLNGL